MTKAHHLCGRRRGRQHHRQLRASPLSSTDCKRARLRSGMAGVGLEYRYPFVSNSPLGRQTDRADRPAHRPAERSTCRNCSPTRTPRASCSTRPTCSPGTNIPATTAIEGGTPRQLRPAIHRQFRQRRPRQRDRRRIDPARRQNSYTIADAANTGLESGLDKQYSNFVAGETLAPFSEPLPSRASSSSTATDLRPAAFRRRSSRQLRRTFERSVDYARYDAQPLTRLALSARGRHHERHLQVQGSAGRVERRRALDMSRHFYDVPGENTPRFYADRLLVRTRLRRRVHDAQGRSIPPTSATRSPSPVCRRAAHPAVRDQTVTVQLVAAHARRHQGRCGIPNRPERRTNRDDRAWRTASARSHHGRSRRHRAGARAQRLARPPGGRRAVLPARRARASARPRQATGVSTRRSSKPSPEEAAAVFDDALPVAPLAHDADARARPLDAALRGGDAGIDRARGRLCPRRPGARDRHQSDRQEDALRRGLRLPGHTEYLGELAKAWGGAGSR